MDPKCLILTCSMVTQTETLHLTPVFFVWDYLKFRALVISDFMLLYLKLVPQQQQLICLSLLTYAEFYLVGQTVLYTVLMDTS